MLHTTALVSLAALSSAVVIDHTGFPRYCAKDMAMSAVQPLSDPLASSLELRQVQIMVRHGARTPWSSGKCWDGYNEVWTCNLRDEIAPVLHTDADVPSSVVFDKIFVERQNFFAGNCLLGQMTDEGYSQQQQNGANFRKAYVGTGPLALFQTSQPVDLTNISDVYFESTDVQRTVNSGQIIVQNLFGNVTSNGRVPWHTNDISRSYATPNPSICPALDKISSEFYTSDEYKAWTKNATNAAWEKELKNYVPGNDRPVLFDCLMTQVCTSRPLPNHMSEDYFVRSTTHEETEQLMMYLHNNNSYAKTGMAKFINQVRTRLEAAIAHQGPRFYLSAIHDSSLMPILAALGGSAYLTEWVPYASHIILELYYQASSSSYYFRLLYQGRPLPVANCASEVCPISAFMKMTEFATNPNICGSVQKFTAVNVTAGPTSPDVLVGVGSTELATSFSLGWVIGVGIIGVIAGIALGYFVSARFASRAGYNPV